MNTRHVVRAVAVPGAALLIAGLVAHAAAASTQADRSPALPPFDRVQTNGAFSTRVIAGRAQHVAISGDAAAVDRVTATVDHGTLEIGMRAGTNTLLEPPHITIAVPTLRAFSNQGAGSVTITGVGGASFDLVNAGAARIRVAGRVRTLSIELDGVGTIDTTALDAHDASVDNNGLGRVDVRASGTLTMNVNGVGEIRYAGNPASVERNVNGIGRIAPL